MARYALIGLTIVAIVIGAVFAIDPGLDLAIAAYFRAAAARPEHFPLMEALELIRDSGPFFTGVAIAAIAVTLAMKLFLPKRRAPMTLRAAFFLILTLTLGPALLVNSVLKLNWARPRPIEVTQFGGDIAFMPWWDPRGACDSNCSFVSGETSTAVWLAAPAVLAPPPLRFIAVGAVGVFASAMALQRMLAGAHFLTDVVFAAIFTGLIIWAVHGLLYRWPTAQRTSDAALDDAFARAGGAIIRALSGRRRSAKREQPAPPA